MIAEKLLQTIWQYQLFNRQALCTTDHQPVQVFKVGTWNHHQGPDFSDAHIKIGKTEWRGNVEVHILSSDWRKHGHMNDPFYQNVVLHVVWEDDEPLPHIPTLVLKHRVTKNLLTRYDQLQDPIRKIPCATHLTQLSALHLTSAKDFFLTLRYKALEQELLRQLQWAQGSWHTLFWIRLARSFGLPNNKSAFEALAKSIAPEIIARHGNNIIQLEALFLGQLQLIPAHTHEPYVKLLAKEYAYLQSKWQLEPLLIPIQFHRIRPAAFPTIRLAQLASLLHHRPQLFHQLLEAESIAEVKALFGVVANDFWHYHYQLTDDAHRYQPKTIGNTMQEKLIVNAVIPVLFAYANYMAQPKLKERLSSWLELMPAEVDYVTKLLRSNGVELSSAADSQAFHFAYRQLCIPRHCLSCPIGVQWLKSTDITNEN